MLVIGNACMKGTLPAVESGALAATTDASPITEGRQMAEFAKRMLKGEKLPEVNLHGENYINAENAAQVRGRMHVLIGARR